MKAGYTNNSAHTHTHAHLHTGRRTATLLWLKHQPGCKSYPATRKASNPPGLSSHSSEAGLHNFRVIPSSNFLWLKTYCTKSKNITMQSSNSTHSQSNLTATQCPAHLCERQDTPRSLKHHKTTEIKPLPDISQAHVNSITSRITTVWGEKTTKYQLGVIWNLKPKKSDAVFMSKCAFSSYATE